jgi:hypothetical protein
MEIASEAEEGGRCKLLCSLCLYVATTLCSIVINQRGGGGGRCCATYNTVYSYQSVRQRVAQEGFAVLCTSHIPGC